MVQNGNGVLNRLVPCLKCMELTCWVLQASLDLDLALYLTCFHFCMGNIKMKRIWQKIFEQTVSFPFPKIHEFGGPPVVPRSLGARLSSCIEDLKAFVIAKFICQFLLCICYQTYYWKMRVGSKFLTWKFVQSCSFLQSPLTYHQHRYIIYWLDIG